MRGIIEKKFISLWPNSICQSFSKILVKISLWMCTSAIISILISYLLLFGLYTSVDVLLTQSKVFYSDQLSSSHFPAKCTALIQV